MVLPLKDSIIYGPVNSRRLGKSLGINLLPPGTKYCSFDCLYCHYGKTTTLSNDPPEKNLCPSIDDVVSAVEDKLNSEMMFQYVTFSGNGEPTLYPYFLDLVREIRSKIKEIRPDVELALLSNSTTVFRPEIRKAIQLIDVPIMKLDAGNPETIRRINRPTPDFDFYRITKGLQNLKGITIQSVFFGGRVSNSNDESIDEWIDAIRMIKPDRVHIYTIDRPVAFDYLEKASGERLQEIASRCRDYTGVKVSVY